jgi:hypothetical protein
MAHWPTGTTVGLRVRTTTAIASKTAVVGDWSWAQLYAPQSS